MDTHEVMNPSKEKEGNLPQTIVKTFPIPGTTLARVLSDPPFRLSFHARLKRYNPLVVILYKIGLLPLLGGSRTLMLLTTRGRKSGKLRSTPIGYFRIGGYIHLFSAWGKATSWYQNMKASPHEVWIQIGLRRRPVRAYVVSEPNEIKQIIAQLIQESPSQAQSLFGWDQDHDRMDCADFSPLVEQVLIIRFEEETA